MTPLIVERNFDVGRMIGPSLLGRFERQRNPERRLHGAVGTGWWEQPGWMCRRLESEIDAGRLTHVVGSIGLGPF